MSILSKRLARLESTLMGLLYQHRQTRKRLELHEQAILELAATLRRSGLSPSAELGALSLHSDGEGSDRQSADGRSTLSA